MASARTKAIAFSAVLLLVSGAFVASAAASATSALAPFRRGDGYALERPLSRHGVTLAVHVGQATEGEPARLAGAEVSIARLTKDGAEPVAEKRTDADGRALFRVARGVYRIDVDMDGLNASRPIAMESDQRVIVYFDEAGRPHWLDRSHDELERRGETRALHVRVVERGRSGDVPLEGAWVRIYRLKDGVRGPLEEEKRTDERGGAVFQLHRAAYEVEVAWENDTATKRIRLAEDQRALFYADGTGLHSAESVRAASRARD